MLTGGGSILQETRHWHEDTGVTTSGREKSDADDYRYFPEPDLVPVAPAREWVEELRAALPEPPRERRARLQADWGFSDLEMRDTVGAGALGAGRGDHRRRRLAAGRPQVVALRAGPPGQRGRRRARRAADHAGRAWPGSRRWSTRARSTTSWPARSSTACSPARARPTRSSPPAAWRSSPTTAPWAAAVDRAIEANPDVAEKIRDGKVAAAGALIGAVMKEMRGQADAGRVRELILERLG